MCLCVVCMHVRMCERVCLLVQGVLNRENCSIAHTHQYNKCKRFTYLHNKVYGYQINHICFIHLKPKCFILFWFWVIFPFLFLFNLNCTSLVFLSEFLFSNILYVGHDDAASDRQIHGCSRCGHFNKNTFSLLLFVKRFLWLPYFSSNKRKVAFLSI